MEVNRAAIVKSPRASVEVEQIETWVPGPGEVLVRNEAIAFNPIEAKIQRWEMFQIEYPAILGYTFAGTVISVGPNVDAVEVGDRVAVACWGRAAGDNKFGAFQKYPLALEENLVKLDSQTSLEQGSGVMANLATVVAALSVCMKLDFPPINGRAPANGKRILIYGGSSSVGSLAVQYATDAGYEVVTTSSPANCDLVQRRGPSCIIDHTKPTEQLLGVLKANGPYDGIFDAIGSSEVTELLGNLLAENGGLFWSTSPTPADSHLPKNVKKEWAGYSDVLVSRDENKDAKLWYLHEYLPKGLSSGRIFSNPSYIFPGGLDSVQDALDTFMTGKVSGKKIFVNPQD
ncbi:putative alcohol dehydrogenase [Aspergillus nomiae NRRL 13137]|uniref:Putative alcohol dehydrogenase n=1 Tax=Aspergillus nomiae NRRL (strain ATCC 15546 / NRRL 13137 / CBS 260.88 / M93) TaxID=1509407 RepID=A0A0L1IQR2_ASPN3|nr:putative alcohol dehydrogenase [Aspergillus nomiae NRRL 13137]KNG81523.1 putative alcohol dehydrogenase [Aspergillus nomiae NRRL 13137]